MSCGCATSAIAKASGLNSLTSDTGMSNGSFPWRVSSFSTVLIPNAAGKSSVCALGDAVYRQNFALESVSNHTFFVFSNAISACRRHFSKNDVEWR